MMIRATWILVMAMVGGLSSLRRGWRRRLADAGACALALALAWWQYPRLLTHVQALWPGPALRQVTLLYLFLVLYASLRVLISLHAPTDRTPLGQRWISGIVGMLQAGGLAALGTFVLPHV